MFYHSFIYKHTTLIIKQKTGFKTQLCIKQTATNNPTPTTERNAVSQMSSRMMTDKPNIHRKLSKLRASNNRALAPGGLKDRKIRYDVTSLANELAATDCKNPRKPHEIPQLNFYAV